MLQQIGEKSDNVFRALFQRYRYKTKMKISIVIPVYNSAMILVALCQQISSALRGRDFEVILVNDGSVDESWSVIEQICEKAIQYKGICLSKNFGQDNAIMAGLQNAKGAYAAIMDDDLQHSPFDIAKLQHEVERGFDVCYADYSERKRQSWWKNVGSIINSKQAEFLLEKPQNIYLSPFKVINRIVIDSIISYKGPYPYVDGLIIQATTSITQISVKHHDRYNGAGNYSLKKSFSVFVKHATGFSVVPLRLAALCGLMTAITGLILSLGYIYQYFVDDKPMEGWTTLVVLILFMGGMILFSLGMIGEYLGRVYLSINQRPQFLVRKIIP